LDGFLGAAELALPKSVIEQNKLMITFFGRTSQWQLKQRLLIPPIAADAVGRFLAGKATQQRM